MPPLTAVWAIKTVFKETGHGAWAGPLPSSTPTRTGGIPWPGRAYPAGDWGGEGRALSMVGLPCAQPLWFYGCLFLLSVCFLQGKQERYKQETSVGTQQNPLLSISQAFARASCLRGAPSREGL